MAALLTATGVLAGAIAVVVALLAIARSTRPSRRTRRAIPMLAVAIGLGIVGAGTIPLAVHDGGAPAPVLAVLTGLFAVLAVLLGLADPSQ